MTQSRDLRLDLWRGVALLMIFVDHIPGNALSAVTLKSFGFSDAAELFVFVAGYSSMLAYGRRFSAGHSGNAVWRILRRVSQLYFAHLVLFALVAVIVSVYGFKIADGDFDDPIVMLPFLADPHTHLKHVLALRYVPKFLDILPLYIALLATLPILLLLKRVHILLCLGVSFIFYVVGQTWDLTSWSPAGSPHWTFNPIAWQFLFTLGVVISSEITRTGKPLPRSKILIGMSAVVVVASAVMAAPWTSIPALKDWTLIDPDFVYSFDKSNLSPIRLIHFLALAYLAAVIVPIDAPLLKTRFARPLIRVGANSLPIFCLGTVLAILGQFTFQWFGFGWSIQLAVDSVGFVTMLLTASMLSFLTERRKHKQIVSDLPGSEPLDGSSRQGPPGNEAVMDSGSVLHRLRPVSGTGCGAALHGSRRLHTS
jgi:hypothetical protein